MTEPREPVRIHVLYVRNLPVILRSDCHCGLCRGYFGADDREEGQ